jgi:hypothetical protein
LALAWVIGTSARIAANRPACSLVNAVVIEKSFFL